ncbi:MAG: hypothetical protein WCK51_00010 [Armatimonadota bacterium]
MLKKSGFGGNFLVLACMVLVVGCADPTKDLTEPTASSIKKIDAIKPTAQAGIDKDVSKSMNPDRLKGLIAATSRFGSRSNPFELSADELRFDEFQASEKFLSDAGHFPNSFELPEDKAEEVVTQEAQPYRRISGIVIGDAVYAILEQDGRSTIIRPGMQIPDTNWFVVSINRDGVTLRRSGNVLPNEVTVRLEVAPPGMSSGAPAGGAPGGGKSSSGPLGGDAL